MYNKYINTIGMVCAYAYINIYLMCASRIRFEIILQFMYIVTKIYFHFKRVPRR